MDRLVSASLDRAGHGAAPYVAAVGGLDAPVMITSASEVLSALRRAVGATNPRAAPLHWVFRLRSVRPSPPTGRLWRFGRVRNVILGSTLRTN